MHERRRREASRLSRTPYDRAKRGSAVKVHRLEPESPDGDDVVYPRHRRYATQRVFLYSIRGFSRCAPFTHGS